MRLLLVLLFCVSLRFTFSAVNEKNKINKDERMIKKTPGRLSRINWQTHEKGMANLDVAMFNDNKMGKARYKKMNYNVQIQHRKNKNNPSTARAKGKRVNRKQKIKEGIDDTTKKELDELTEQIEGENKKRKIGKKISIGSSDFKRKFKKVPNIKERNQFYRRNIVEHNELDEDKTTRQRKTPNKEKQSETIAQNYEAHKINLNRPPTKQKKTELKHEKLVQKAVQTMPKPKTGLKVKKRVKKVYENPKAQRNLINEDRLKSLNNIHEDTLTQHTQYANSVKIIRRKSLPLSANEKLKQQVKDSARTFTISSVFEFPANTPKAARELKKVHTDDDPSIANELYSKVRILCWVITYPSNHYLTLKAIKSTWGRRCNKLLFISSALNNDEYVPTVKLNVSEGRMNLWVKNKAAFKYVYENYHDAYDWYVRTDDDTYMIIENLRYMLAYYNPSDPLFFGCRFKPYATQGYMSGGAGVVLSREALNKLGRGLNDSELCEFRDAADDVNLGICLHRVGVKAVDSRDSLQKIRFLPVMPQDLMEPYKDRTFWYWSFEYYPTEPGIGCCSDYTVSFHYVTPADMYAFEFLIYRVRAFGIRHGNAPIPPLISQTTHKNDVREKTSETPERILLTVEEGMKSSTMTLGEIATRLDDQGFELPTEKNIKEETTESSTQKEVTEKKTKATKIAKEIKGTTSIYHFIKNNKYFKKTKTATTETVTTEIITTETDTTETATSETDTTETAVTETATTETTAHKRRLLPVFYDIHNYKGENSATRNDIKTNLDNRVINMINSNSIEIVTDFTTEKVTTEDLKSKSTLLEFDESFVSEEEFTTNHKIEPQMIENRH